MKRCREWDDSESDEDMEEDIVGMLKSILEGVERIIKELQNIIVGGQAGPSQTQCMLN